MAGPVLHDHDDGLVGIEAFILTRLNEQVLPWQVSQIRQNISLAASDSHSAAAFGIEGSAFILLAGQIDPAVKALARAGNAGRAKTRERRGGITFVRERADERAVLPNFCKGEVAGDDAAAEAVHLIERDESAADLRLADHGKRDAARGQLVIHENAGNTGRHGINAEAVGNADHLITLGRIGSAQHGFADTKDGLHGILAVPCGQRISISGSIELRTERRGGEEEQRWQRECCAKS